MWKSFRWVLILVLGLLLGSSYVQYLVSHPLQMDIYLSFVFITIFVLIVVCTRSFSGRQRFGAVGVVLASYATGWYIMTDVILDRQDSRPMPELTRTKDDPGTGHTAVIYMTHGEPPTYDPISWVNQMNEFDEQRIEFVPFMARPFFMKGLRDSYLKVGKSEHRQKSQGMFEALEQAYRRSGDMETKFYLSFLDDNPRVGAAVIRALNDGASRIVVSEVFVTISSHTAEGEHQIREMEPEAYGVDLKFTGPLWDSEYMYQMFVNRVNENLGGSAKANVGVLLVAHGQPDEWDEIWPLQTEHEMLFGDRVLERLESAGYKRENMGKAWMSFKNPVPAVEVERIFANGVEKLFFFSYTIAAAGIHSQFDIPELVREARVPDDFPIVNLGAWGNDPLAIKALKEKIDAQMQADTKLSATTD